MDLAYRRSAVTGASGLGQLIALYDALAGDLHRAASAQQAGDLEQRAQAVKHALTVIGFLEIWLERGSGELAQQLIEFYAALRRRLLAAQARQSVQPFEDLITEILEVREIWRQMESKGPLPAPQILPPVVREQHSGPFSTGSGPRVLSWSA